MTFYTKVPQDVPVPDAARSQRDLLVAGFGIFMVFLDTQILFVAFNDIRASFPDVSTTAMSWVLSGYTLVFAALLVPAGRLADRWGRKSVFLWGLALFTIASAACGLAPTAGLLIVARLLQAVGAAAITPTSLALVLRATPRERVPIAVAIWGSMGAVAAAFGPTLGGLLVDAAGWRWVFFVNLPVCLVAIVAGRRVLERVPRGRIPARSPISSGRRCSRPAWPRSRWRSCRATSGDGSTRRTSAPSPPACC